MSVKPDAAIQAAMLLCQPYMREPHPMQYASGGSTAFGLNPRAFDMLAQVYSEKAASKPLSKNQRKRLNKKKRAEQSDL